MVIVHSHKDLAMIRKRANEGDWSRGECEIAAPMGTPTRLHGLLLGGAIDYAHIGSTIDESRHADRDLGLAIFATHQQTRPVVARRQRRRDERAVVERGFFIGDDPRHIAARSALAQPLPRVRGGPIEAVVAFEPLAIFLDLTCRLTEWKCSRGYSGSCRLLFGCRDICERVWNRRRGRSQEIGRAPDDPGLPAATLHCLRGLIFLPGERHLPR
jgi:hypothetical protein